VTEPLEGANVGRDVEFVTGAIVALVGGGVVEFTGIEVELDGETVGSAGNSKEIDLLTRST
jgi:hypothetical protein